MNKVPVIVQSEFLRRVRSKWFILSTFLGPLAILALIGTSILVSVRSVDNVTSRTIAVIDETGVLFDRMAAGDQQILSMVSYDSADDARDQVVGGTLDGYLVLPAGVLAGDARPTYFSLESAGFSLEDMLRDRIQGAVRAHRIEEADVPPEVQEIFYTRIGLDPVRLSEEGEEEGSSFMYMGLGYAMGFLIYIAMLIYGSLVMAGVIEEKSSRVVEIIVSSVRPFELLMGKVLGIGAVGVAQMMVWGLLLMGGIAAAGMVAGMFVDPAALDLTSAADGQEVLEALGVSLPAVDIGLIVWFVLYFLMGYLLYAALFAAVGAMVEQQQEAQGWMLPIMVPVILSIVFMMPVLQSPQSALAIATSPHSLHVPDSHGRAHGRYPGAALAAPAFLRAPCGRIHGGHLVKQPHLPRRHPEVRQEAGHSGTDPVVRDGLGLEQLRLRGFQAQQKRLSLDASAVSRKGAARTHDAVTRGKYGDGIGFRWPCPPHVRFQVFRPWKPVRRRKPYYRTGCCERWPRRIPQTAFRAWQSECQMP